MKKLLPIFTLVGLVLIKSALGQTTTANLNGVTFGFGAGYGYTFNNTYDYALTTDASHNLILQSLNKQAFVISSVIMVKLGKLAVDPGNNMLISQAKIPDYKAKGKTAAKKWTDFKDRLSINLALNLVEVGSNVSFNKNIDGGLGLGYFLNDNLQLALFYDVSRIRQLRDYIVNNYENKPIPNGNSTSYNSLDSNDNNLFYNKTVSGLSVKLIFSIANQKTTP